MTHILGEGSMQITLVEDRSPTIRFSGEYLVLFCNKIIKLLIRRKFSNFIGCASNACYSPENAGRRDTEPA